MTRIDWASAIRPLPGQLACGDLSYVRVMDDLAWIVLVDVLGHGAPAGKLAAEIFAWLESQPVMEPEATIEALDRAIRGSRGCVASVAVIDAAARRLRYGGIGNITARLIGPGAEQFVNRDGVVGYRIVHPPQIERMLMPGATLLMHTDGISSRAVADRVREFEGASASTIAERMLSRCSKPTDDAGVLVAGIR